MAVSPSQLYTISGRQRDHCLCHTQERILAIPDEHLSAGEDASFTSYDGLRISARLYMPAAPLEYQGKRPLVYYLHGGPQSQERPDFAWFSMPLIQFLALPNHFAGYDLTRARLVEIIFDGPEQLRLRDHTLTST